MSFRIRVVPYRLNFKFDARTSRGSLQHHQVYFLVLENTSEPGITGIGECAPLQGLSPDYEIAPVLLPQIAAEFALGNIDSVEALRDYIRTVSASDFPSVTFALETALLDYKALVSKVLFKSDFTLGLSKIPINGLIWMGDKNRMLEQISQKIDQGFSCLKLKVGSLEFEEELAVIAQIRSEYSSDHLTIRLDANGAFANSEALEKLMRLSEFDIHSIEQPIKQGLWTEMAELCAKSPVAIALDEELIGNQTPVYKGKLLETIRPQFIILKPTLHGGLASCEEWISLAEKLSIPWWITSALESNIGLNCIAQFTATYPVNLPQGLGTGALYHNNIASPLTVQNGNLHYDKAKSWDVSAIMP